MASIKTFQVLADQYRIERELGRGGSAVVYRALDERHDRRVAVKVLHPELANALGSQRFLREIKMTAGMQHPHIVPIFDSGETADGLLYYVMPFVEEDSLRRRLVADNRLPVNEAVQVAREVASALAYAHQTGVLHRDIKPENILFLGGHACLTDFGIARPMRASADRLTAHDVVVGTPEYMSPEQGRNRVLDGRSDVYSLACVLYEMLAGVPPFPADSPVDSLRMRYSRTPPPVRTYRAEVPQALEDVLSRALATSPDERYENAIDFAEALANAVSGSSTRISGAGARRGEWARRTLRSPWAMAAGIGFALAAVGLAAPPVRDSVFGPSASYDSTAYAVLPLDAQSDSAGARLAEALRAAMGEWEDVRTISGLELDRVLSDRAPDGVHSVRTALGVARALGAGRLVWGRVTPGAGHADVAVYDTRTGRVLAETRIASGNDGGAARAVANLLAPGSSAAVLPHTRSAEALRAWREGQAGLANWNLVAAESAFTHALARDPRLVEARIGLGQSLVWLRRPKAEWRRFATITPGELAGLDARDAAIGTALAAMADDRHPEACGIYRAMAAADSLDAIAWVGLGDCQALDERVVRDPRSESGWRFRASLTAAMGAYDIAVAIDPRARATLPLRYLARVLPSEVSRLRYGRAEGDDVPFQGRPVVRADTIAYVPVQIRRPTDVLTKLHAPNGYDEAYRRNRDRLLRYVSNWVARGPRGPEMFEALAAIREENGDLGAPGARDDGAALAALDSAARLAETPAERARVGISRLRVLVKASAFDAARAFADSLLASPDTAIGEAAGPLTTVAVLTGRAELAQRLALRGDGATSLPSATVPRPVRSAADRLIIRAALGVCHPGVPVALGELDEAIVAYVEPTQRASLRAQAVGRPLMLAWPCLGVAGAREALLSNTPVSAAQYAFATGDVAAARRQLDSTLATRRLIRAGSVTPDHLLLESALRLALGDTTAAESQLDGALDALPALGPRLMDEVGLAGAIPRAFALRADVAARRGDRVRATHWATATLSLWANADPAFAPVISRMRSILRAK